MPPKPPPLALGEIQQSAVQLLPNMGRQLQARSGDFLVYFNFKIVFITP